MLVSCKVAMELEDSQIPPLPFANSEHEVRALVALYFEKNEFSSSQPQFKKNVNTVLRDMNIPEQDQKRLKSVFEDYYQFIETVVNYIKKTASNSKTEKGTFKYPKKNYVYYDNVEELWFVNLEKLHNSQTKFDNINIFVGQVVFIFNPTERDGKIIVSKDEYKVRVYGANTPAQVLQNWQQQLVQASQCTCGNTPCTCGAGLPNAPDEEKGSDESVYEKWDKLMQNTRDRDIVLVYQDGVEKMRF